MECLNKATVLFAKCECVTVHVHICPLQWRPATKGRIQDGSTCVSEITCKEAYVLLVHHVCMEWALAEGGFVY